MVNRPLQPLPSASLSRYYTNRSHKMPKKEGKQMKAQKKEEKEKKEREEKKKEKEGCPRRPDGGAAAGQHA